MVNEWLGGPFKSAFGLSGIPALDVWRYMALRLNGRHGHAVIVVASHSNAVVCAK